MGNCQACAGDPHKAVRDSYLKRQNSNVMSSKTADSQEVVDIQAIRQPIKTDYQITLHEDPVVGSCSYQLEDPEPSAESFSSNTTDVIQTESSSISASPRDLIPTIDEEFQNSALSNEPVQFFDEPVEVELPPTPTPAEEDHEEKVIQEKEEEREAEKEDEPEEEKQETKKDEKDEDPLVASSSFGRSLKCEIPMLSISSAVMTVSEIIITPRDIHDNNNVDENTDNDDDDDDDGGGGGGSETSSSSSSEESEQQLDECEDDEDSKVILSQEEHREYCATQHKNAIERAKKAKCYQEGPTQHPYLSEPERVEVTLQRPEFPGIFGLSLKGRNIDKVQPNSVADNSNKLQPGMIVTHVNDEVIDVRREHHLRSLLSNAALAPACQQQQKSTTPTSRKRVSLSGTTERILQSPIARRKRSISSTSPVNELKSSLATSPLASSRLSPTPRLSPKSGKHAQTHHQRPTIPKTEKPTPDDTWDQSGSSMGISSSSDEGKDDDDVCKRTLIFEDVKTSARSTQKTHPTPRRNPTTVTFTSPLPSPKPIDDTKTIIAYKVGSRFLNPDLLSPVNLNPQTINKGLAEARRILGTFSYCFTGSKFDIAKTRSVRHMNQIAVTILRDGVDIQCVEGTFVGLLLTHNLMPVVRFGLSFETLSPDGTLYRHLVLGLKYNKRYCTLGISRESDLMTKPAVFTTLSMLINDFVIGYNRIGQIVTKVLISRPISRKDNVVPDWKVGRFPIDPAVGWTLDIEKKLKTFEMAFLTEAPYSVGPGSSTGRRSMIPPLKPANPPPPVTSSSPSTTPAAAAAAAGSPRKCLPQTPRNGKFLGLKTPRTKWV